MLLGHSHVVECIQFSPETTDRGESLFLASGARDNSIKIWNTQDASCVATLVRKISHEQLLDFSRPGVVRSPKLGAVSFVCGQSVAELRRRQESSSVAVASSSPVRAAAASSASPLCFLYRMRPSPTSGSVCWYQCDNPALALSLSLIAL